VVTCAFTLVEFMATAVPSASFDFAATLDKFNEVTLPAEISSSGAGGQDLTTEEAGGIFFAPIVELYKKTKREDLGPVAARWNTPQAQADTKTSFEAPTAPDAGMPSYERIHPVWRTKVGDKLIVLVTWSQVMAVGGTNSNYLLMFNANNKLTGVGFLTGFMDSEMATIAGKTTLAADLTIVTETTTTLHSFTIPALEGVQIIEVAKSAMGPDGKMRSVTTTFENLAGKFFDVKSGEILIISDKDAALKVSYEAKADKPVVELTVSRIDRDKAVIEAQFPNAKGTYVLTFAKDRKTLSCKNPDKSKQTFTREY
jgi:hypothetical protein